MTDQAVPAHGAIEMMTYGGSTVRKQRYCYNNRLQMTGMLAGVEPTNDCAGASTTFLRLYMTYGASNNGNLETQAIASDGFLVQQSYTYDKLNRLEMALEAGATGWKQTNRYDRWGNRWVDEQAANTYPASLKTQATAAGSFTAKNRLDIPGTFDSAGNQTTTNGFGLFYDAENRLTTATHGANASKNQVFAYDAEGRRVKQVSGGGGMTLTTFFVYDAMGELAAEYEVNVGSYPKPAVQCLTCYLAQDHLGSTRALWDDSGVKARFDYLPFGETVPGDLNGRGALTCAAGVTNCYNGPGSLTQKFTGKERDGETGLDYFGARYFSSAQGRFTSPDAPFADQHTIDPQSWNLYVYVRNNPLKNTDPNGRDCFQGVISCANYVLGGVGAVTNAFSSGLINLPNRLADGLVAPFNGGQRVFGDLVPDAFTPTNVDQSQGMEAANAVMLLSPLAELGGTRAVSAAAEVPLVTRNGARGAASESRVLNDMGLTKNTTPITGTAGRSIPDINTSTVVGDIKDVKVVSNTPQMKIQRQVAGQTGRDHVIVTGTNTHVTKPTQQPPTRIIRRDDLGPPQ